MPKPNKRRVKMEQFKAQIAEQVLPDDNLIPVELPDGSEIMVKIPVALGEDDSFMDDFQAASTEEELALVILSGGVRPAGEQWEAWKAAGYTGADLLKLWRVETDAANERLAAFRYKG